MLVQFEDWWFIEGAAFVSIVILFTNLVVKCIVYFVRKMIKRMEQHAEESLEQV
jgi:hypothetical protein